MNEEEPNSESDVSVLLKSLGYTAGMHAIFAAILSVFFWLHGKSEGDYTMLFPLLCLGVTQTLYMIPAFVIAKGKGNDQLAKGLLIGAGVTFLLNAACAGYALSTL